MKKIIPTEDQEAQAFVQWLRMKGLMFTHIANESGLPPRVAMLAAKKKKLRGVAKGVPDYMIIVPDGLAFVEMKRQKGSHITPEQREWVKALSNIPYVEAEICFGADDAIQFISQFL